MYKINYLRGVTNEVKEQQNEKDLAYDCICRIYSVSRNELHKRILVSRFYNRYIDAVFVWCRYCVCSEYSNAIFGENRIQEICC